MDPVWSDIGSSHGARPEKVVWTPYMEHRFIEFMHEEFISHRLPSSTFSPFVWARICEKMNSTMSPGYVFMTDQLKGKLNRLCRAWRLMNDILNRGTGWGWDSEHNTIKDDAGRLEDLYRIHHSLTLRYFENPEYKKIVEHGLPHFDLCTQMFARNTASGGFARSSANPPRAFHTVNEGGDEQMTGTSSGGRRSRDDYEDTAVSESSQIGTPHQWMPSVQHLVVSVKHDWGHGKIDRAGPKATYAIERCVDELTKFKDLPDGIFTTALERFHSHNTRTIFLRLDDENKLRWLYSLGK
ncbi:hypothetical protein Salat_1455100 [Sesamum alatum]|uniref:Myb/SANT-like domain-containing protein n=1 Tax=Sesamum alatum TaxID=300844 RepID=A0AAE1YB08_9LAMI|nr:hypothetical protein Salat_1455100 [Sesamum alatum]